jgi:hypothetical protein
MLSWIEAKLEARGVHPQISDDHLASHASICISGVNDCINDKYDGSNASIRGRIS